MSRKRLTPPNHSDSLARGYRLVPLRTPWGSGGGGAYPRCLCAPIGDPGKQRGHRFPVLFEACQQTNKRGVRWPSSLVYSSVFYMSITQLSSKTTRKSKATTGLSSTSSMSDQPSECNAAVRTVCANARPTSFLSWRGCGVRSTAAAPRYTWATPFPASPVRSTAWSPVPSPGLSTTRGSPRRLTCRFSGLPKT